MLARVWLAENKSRMRDLRSVDEEARFFLDNGYLVLRGVLQQAELARLQTAMERLMAQAAPGTGQPLDYRYRTDHRTGQSILRRIEYVIDKSDECKIL